MLAGHGAADLPRGGGALLPGGGLTLLTLVDNWDVHTSLGGGRTALVLHRGMAHLRLQCPSIVAWLGKVVYLLRDIMTLLPGYLMAILHGNIMALLSDYHPLQKVNDK